ncbi:MAG: hypothetical protein R3212_11030, partial [Xanthomonadales bacterium]|nr:hypothetical protein [Xanthomonadales bacterium]
MRGAAITEQRSWLIAIRAPCLGGAKLVRLVEAFGGIEGLVSSPESALRKAGLESETISSLKNPDPDLLAL